MPTEPTLVLSLDHDHFGAPESSGLTAFLKQSARAGFDAVMLPVAMRLDETPDDATAGAIAAIGQAGMRPIIRATLARFPNDHPLVERHPDDFLLRREHPADVPVDPREPLPEPSEAMLRPGGGTGRAIVDAIVAYADTWVEAGVAGLMIEDAARFPRIVEAIAARGTVSVMVGHGIDTDGAVRVVAPAGVLLSDDRPTADLIAFDRRIRGDGDRIAARIALASAIAGGVVLSSRLVERLGDRLAAALTSGAKSSVRGGTWRKLATGDPDLAAYAKFDSADPRWAKDAEAIMVNLSDAPYSVGETLRRAIAETGFIVTTDDDDALAPNAVRRFALAPAAPILSPPPTDRMIAAPRLVVEDIAPAVAGGDFAVKRIVGETVLVEASIYTDGHEQLGAELLWRAEDERDWRRVTMTALGNDRWSAAFTLDRMGRYRFAVEGWLDVFGGLRRDLGKKLDAGVAMLVDLREGVDLVAAAAKRSARVRDWSKRLQKADDEDRAGMLLSDDLAAVMAEVDRRPHRLRSGEHALDAERIAARYSSWYELFPRSQVDDPAKHGTFIDVIDRLPAIRDMGFDTLYFPPIHPIGKTNRKGPNNTLTPGPDDPGSPYAIGSEAGGHDAVHPELGGFEAFDTLVAAAREHGLEIALDFAIQASPDHPWLKEHPGWFAWRPDGTMKYAENPPKKYQDIVNVDFYGPDAVPELWLALRDVVLLWIGHGVKTFRVDNPHTKPLPFWEWMIRDVRARYPDAIFLAEAFTRPAMMYRLAKIGFSQSYTYFTWRDGKQELTDYIVELTTTAPKDFYRPHFFVNTPDINPVYLQTSGRPGFRIRAVLAATLGGLFGVYSGFELCESAAIPGKEEYLDSEKYIVKPRDWQAPGNIIADITLLNRLRRENRALQTHLDTRFYVAHDANIIWYGKPDPDGRGMIMVMVNMDPHHAHECTFEVPLWEFGIADDGSIAVEDLAAGHRFDWYGKEQHIRIAPDEPYRIWRLTPGDAA